MSKLLIRRGLHMSRSVRLVLGCLPLVITPWLAHGQVADSGKASPAHWITSLGVDPFEFRPTERRGLEGSLFATVGRVWSRPGSGAALRTQLSLGSRTWTSAETLLDGCNGCGSSFAEQFAALTTLAMYEWRASSLIRPYVLGGPGLFALRRHGVSNACQSEGVCQGSSALFPSRAPTTRWSLGATAGFGVAIGKGARSVLFEQSIQLSDILRPTRSSGFAPLTVGFRF
jgi:hypothetical protein